MLKSAIKTKAETIGFESFILILNKVEPVLRLGELSFEPEPTVMEDAEQDFSGRRPRGSEATDGRKEFAGRIPVEGETVWRTTGILIALTLTVVGAVAHIAARRILKGSCCVSGCHGLAPWRFTFVAKR